MESQRAPYRNAIRSRTLIRDAFVQLMWENDVTKIKAKDVIDLANVSKGTFYAHYDSVFEVYRDIENECLALMFKIFQDPNAPITFENMLPLFLDGLEEIENQQDTFRVLFRCTYSERFLGKVKQRFLECMLENCEADGSVQDREMMRGFFTFAAGGSLALLCEWIDAKERVPSAECARFINGCITNGLGVLQARKEEHVDQNMD